MTREEREKIEDEWITWQRSLNKELTETQYRVIYLPPIDLMPYEDGALITSLQNELDALEDNLDAEKMALNEDEAKVIGMALTVYKTVLLTIHGERLRKEIREATEKRKKEETDGK